MSIKITEKARSELIKLGLGPERFLRIGVVPGGCSGMTYTAAIETEVQADDQPVYEDAEIRIVTDSGSALFLDGLHVDYSDDLIRSGFRFISPDRNKSCGCGSSFSA
jgi:iron-sulfur cluster assembly protein